MTDARLRGEWLNTMRFDNLSDSAWRVFTSALMWSNENGTNGLVPTRYLKMTHPDGEKPEAFEQIVNAALWEKVEGGYQLIDWDGALGQNTDVQVETYKANARNRARAYRERERQKLAKAVGFVESHTPSVTRDVSRDVREHVGKGKGEGKGAAIQTKVSDETTQETTGSTPAKASADKWIRPTSPAQVVRDDAVAAYVDSVNTQTGEVTSALDWDVVEIPKDAPPADQCSLCSDKSSDLDTVGRCVMCRPPQTAQTRAA